MFLESYHTVGFSIQIKSTFLVLFQKHDQGEEELSGVVDLWTTHGVFSTDWPRETALLLRLLLPLPGFTVNMQDSLVLSAL